MAEYSETHPVHLLRGYLEHPDSGASPSLQKEVERLIMMWEALDAQTRVLKAAADTCGRCAAVEALFPAPEPAPIDAATVKAWIDENVK